MTAGSSSILEAVIASVCEAIQKLNTSNFHISFQFRVHVIPAQAGRWIHISSATLHERPRKGFCIPDIYEVLY